MKLRQGAAMEDESYEELVERHKQITGQLEKAATENPKKEKVKIKEKHEKEKLAIQEKYEKQMEESEQEYKTSLTSLCMRETYYDTLYDEEDKLSKELTKRRRVMQENLHKEQENLHKDDEEMAERRRRISRAAAGREEEDGEKETGCCDNLVRMGK